MKGLELLDAAIEHYEDILNIAENEIQNNRRSTGSAGKAWIQEKYKAEKNLKVLQAIKAGINEDKTFNAITQLMDTGKVRLVDEY